MAHLPSSFNIKQRVQSAEIYFNYEQPQPIFRFSTKSAAEHSPDFALFIRFSVTNLDTRNFHFSKVKINDNLRNLKIFN